MSQVGVAAQLEAGKFQHSFTEENWLMHTPIVSNSDIGATIRRRRQELSLSQEELAFRLQLSNQQVQRYESGKDRLNVERLQALALALSVPVSYFLHNGSAPEIVRENECERELLSHYRKIQDGETKKLVVGLARTLALAGG
jgi:transcriptional regulator with XRE-family HTH domain